MEAELDRRSAYGNRGNWPRSCFTPVQVEATLYNAVLVFFRTRESLQRSEGWPRAASLTRPRKSRNPGILQCRSTAIEGTPRECVTVLEVGMVFLNRRPKPRGANLPTPMGTLGNKAPGRTLFLRSTVQQRKGPRTSLASCGDWTILIRPLSRLPLKRIPL